MPDTVSDRHAVFTEPLAAALEILDQVEILAEHRVAIVGDGKLGQLICRVIVRTGCDLTMIGKHDTKMELAARIGVKTARPDGAGIANFDFVIDASGSPGGLRLAIDLIKPRGAIILKSTFSGEISVDSSKLVVNEISLIGSRCGRFEPALRLLESGEIDLEPLVECEYMLAGAVEAIAWAARPGTLKVLLKN